MLKKNAHRNKTPRTCMVPRGVILTKEPHRQNCRLVPQEMLGTPVVGTEPCLYSFCDCIRFLLLL